MKGYQWIVQRSFTNRSGSYRTLACLKKQLIERHDGRCSKCGTKTPLNDFDLDHSIPLALGGGDQDEDIQPMCVPCHAKKTAIDIKIIAAARNLNYIDSHRIWADPAFLREFYLRNCSEVERTNASRKEQGYCLYKGRQSRRCFVATCAGAH